MITCLSDNNSVIAHFIAELRDVSVQSDALRFRRNLERIGEIMAYEISKELKYVPKEITTPLGKSIVNEVENQPVIAAVLRAALPMHTGILNYFDKAENIFVSAYRKHKEASDDFHIEVEYLAGPSIEDKTIIICDPMLATGASLVAVYKAILKLGTPNNIYISAAIASKEGIAFVREHFPENTGIWVGTIDSELNDKGYIVPGLGDAGDLAFGQKMDF